MITKINDEGNITLTTTTGSIAPYAYATTGYFSIQERNIIEKLTDREHLYRFDEEIEDASDKELIEEYIYLIKNAIKIQQEYEFYLISHKDEIDKYKKLLGGGKDLLKDSYTNFEANFILETEVFDAIQEELYGRGYEEYCAVLWDRYFIDCE